MNAHALLTSQGWRGAGNSLHPTDNTIGLSRPILVSKKDNTLGVGKKQHSTSDMWWMNAFDKSLRGLDTSKEGTVVQTLTTGGLDVVKRGGGKWVLEKGGLYGSFVRGEGLCGTITPEEGVETVEKKSEKKRKRECETDEERKARKAAKKASTEDALAVKEPLSELSSRSESKEERRARREAKRKLRESQSTKVPRIEEVDIADKIETKEERKARRASRKAKQEGPIASDESPELEPAEVQISKVETKEERKERRQLKKLSKEACEATAEDLSENPKKKKRRKE